MKNKGVIILVVSLILILGLFITINTSFKKTVNWEESYNEKRSNPYDLKIFYKELPKIFKNQKIRTVYHTPYNYLSEHVEYGMGDHIAEGTYMIIGNTSYIDDLSADELLAFVSDGNHLFISAYNIPYQLKFDFLSISPS